MINDPKTPIQEQIEYSVTNGRSYLTIPYTKLFGQKMALKQWFLFSNFRPFSPLNHSVDKTSLLHYILSFFDVYFEWKERELEEQIQRGIFATVFAAQKRMDLESLAV